MELAMITAGQVTVLFILILTGFVCVKTGILKQEAKKPFSDLLIYLIIPAMIKMQRTWRKAVFSAFLI